jgi:hypothetical protein
MAGTGAAQAAAIWGLLRVDCVRFAGVLGEVPQRSRQYISIPVVECGHDIQRAACAHVSKHRSRSNNRLQRTALRAAAEPGRYSSDTFPRSHANATFSTRLPRESSNSGGGSRPHPRIFPGRRAGQPPAASLGPATARRRWPGDRRFRRRPRRQAWPAGGTRRQQGGGPWHHGPWDVGQPRRSAHSAGATCWMPRIRFTARVNSLHSLRRASRCLRPRAVRR